MKNKASDFLDVLDDIGAVLMVLVMVAFTFTVLFTPVYIQL